jgi:hypothetical protein
MHTLKTKYQHLSANKNDFVRILREQNVLGRIINDYLFTNTQDLPCVHPLVRMLHTS